MKRRLDAVDRTLLAMLQANGRTPNVELAAAVGLSAPPCLRRLRQLEDARIVKGYHADLDAQALGFDIVAFAMVTLQSQAEHQLRAFEAHVAALPPVRECHMLNGDIDFLLKIVAEDLGAFQDFLTTSLTTAPNVAHVRTSLTIRTAKLLPGVPLTSGTPG